MKQSLIFCLVFLLLFVSGVAASEKGPKAVSPGLKGGVAVVGQSCPTFSWTAVEWAVAYKVTVFIAIGAEVLSYEEMAAKSYPVLSQEIQGRALSWTPSSEERLSNGSMYVWYVQAMDAYGTAKWSQGRVFMVKVEDRFGAVVDEVTETLKEYGISDDVIGEVLKGIATEMEAVNIDDLGTNKDGYNTQDKIGIQGNEVGTNTWYGQYAGASLTTADYNSFFGQYAGHNTTTGDYNTFIGRGAGHNTTTGNYNTFMGAETGVSNTTADNNTFIGHSAGNWNTTGYNNTFIGRGAGNWNTTGYENTFIGRFAGYINTSGNYNTFMGEDAGYGNTTADYNTFIGQYSGRNNTTGYANTFMGQSAGANNETGYNNTFIGRSAGVQATTGYSNTFIGYAAGVTNKTGYGNIFLGYYAGYNETGSNKLYVDNSNTSSPLIYGEFDSDIVAINGKLGVGTSSPQADLEVETSGKDAIFLLDRTDGAKTGIAAYGNLGVVGTVTNHPLLFVVNYAWKLKLKSDNSLAMANGAKCTRTGVWQDASSRELKEDIRSLSANDAKDTLDALKPVRFKYKKDKEEEYLGFIAEDVPELVASKDRKGMSPMDVVAVLTKVAQEQQKTISELQKRITELERKAETEF